MGMNPQFQPPVDSLIRECCQAENHEAWHTFVERFNPFILIVVRDTVRRWSASFQLTEDLAQEVYLKLYSKRIRVLGDFRSEHDGAFYGYLKGIAANVVHDHFKARHAPKRGAGIDYELLEEEIPSRDDPRERFHWSIWLTAADLGVDLGDRKLILGHATDTMALHYSHAAVEDMRDPLDRIAERLLAPQNVDAVVN